MINAITSKDRGEHVQVFMTADEKAKAQVNAALICIEAGIKPNTSNAVRFLLTKIDPSKLARLVKESKGATA